MFNRIKEWFAVKREREDLDAKSRNLETIDCLNQELILLRSKNNELQRLIGIKKEEADIWRKKFAGEEVSRILWQERALALEKTARQYIKCWTMIPPIENDNEE